VTNVKQGTTQVASYDYDAFGHRTQTEIGTSKYEYIYDRQGKPYETVTGLNFQQTELYADATHVGVYASGTTQFSHVNWLGTETVHTGPGGSDNSTCSGYLPFGDGATCSGTAQTWDQPQFTGQWQDLETDLDHMANRYYSPVEGRWTTPDPSGINSVDPTNPQSRNFYAYVGNNPSIFTDPTGLQNGCPIPANQGGLMHTTIDSR